MHITTHALLRVSHEKRSHLFRILLWREIFVRVLENNLLCPTHILWSDTDDTCNAPEFYRLDELSCGVSAYAIEVFSLLSSSS